MVRRLWKSNRNPDRYDRSGSSGDQNKEDEDHKEDETKENEHSRRSDVVREREQPEEAATHGVPMPLQQQALPGLDESSQAQTFGVANPADQAQAGPSRLKGNSRAGAEEPPRLKRERPQIIDRVQSPHPNDPVEEDDIDISLDDIDMAFSASASASEKSPSPHPTCSAENTPRLVLRPPRPPPRLFDQRDLGLPERGIPRLKDGHKHVYHGPMGRRVVVSNEHNPNYRSKDQPFLWVRIQNDNSDVSLTGKKAADLYEEVAMAMAQRGYGSIRSETEESTCQPKSRSAVATEIVLPRTMGIEPILSDSGQNFGRGRLSVHLTFAAVLYMVGWLDDDFELINGEPDWDALIEWFENEAQGAQHGGEAEQGQVEADSGYVEGNQPAALTITNPVQQQQLVLPNDRAGTPDQHAFRNDRAGGTVQSAVANDRAGAPVDREPPSDRRARTRSSANPHALLMLGYGEQRQGAVPNTEANWAGAGLPSAAEYHDLQTAKQKAKDGRKITEANWAGAGTLSAEEYHDLRTAKQKAQHKAKDGRKISGLPNRGGHSVEIERNTPKFWDICEPLAAGNFCATLCRIQVPAQERTGRHRSYRTMCILTTRALPIPTGRPLPTCKAVVKVDAVLERCRDIHLDEAQIRKAIQYTVKMFSLPRRKTLEARELPYLVLPMSMQWGATFNAMSEVQSIRQTDVERNLGWTEIDSALDHEKETRMVNPLDSIERKRGGAMAAFAEESIYIVHGAQYNEVHETCWDEESRAKARKRAIDQAVKANPEGPEEVPEIQGPVFELRQIPDFWNPAHGPVTMTNLHVDPNLEPRSTIARRWVSRLAISDCLTLTLGMRSIYHSAHMLPWIMWTIDGLLLAQEVNQQFLDSQADTYDVLAALSTTQSSRDNDLEVLEFAGDTYWKFAATEYHFHSSPTKDYQELNRLVRGITDNAPLARGMKESGAESYIMNDPVDTSNFLPPGCDYKNSYGKSRPPRLNLLSPKSIADVAEALAGAVGKVKDNELLLRTCMRLFPSAFSFRSSYPPELSWRAIAQMDTSLNFGNRSASQSDVDYVQRVTGHKFENRNLLGLILDPRNACRGGFNSISMRLTFLGDAIFDCILMDYLIAQGAAQNLDPGQLTHWRTKLASSVSLAALWVNSGLHRVVGGPRGKIHQFEYELQKTVDTQTELHMAWTKISNVPKLDGHVYLLLAGVLADSGWSFPAATDLFDRLYLPFFARFVGSYDRDRLDSIPEPDAARLKLQQGLRPCKDVHSTTTVMPHGIFNTDVKCHSRVIGNGRSLYQVAAEGFAYREAQKFILDAPLRQALIRKYCNCLDGLLRKPAATGVPPQSAEPSTGIRQADRKQETLAKDGFEIVADPGLVGSVVGRLSKVVPATRKASSSDDSGEQERENKLGRYDI